MVWRNYAFQKAGNVVLAVFIFLSSSCIQSEQHNIRVYITKTGNKYHTGECVHLGKSKIPMKLTDAIAEGYVPCQKCNATSVAPKKLN